FKRWFWLLIEAGLFLSLVFLGWLFFQSVYRIGALCPYCLAVDAVSLPMFWYVTLYNIDQKNIRLPKGRARTVYGWIRRHHLDILVVVFLLLIGLVLNHFWYYYGRNL
ncbi:MAG TPA: vitamin K epoxide reductase family protein, partial [Verrucomicrobiae bacterium]|nr:vitamin K epoxide reductase family protein [Verrucomicrobiae bacterium]